MAYRGDIFEGLHSAQPVGGVASLRSPAARIPWSIPLGRWWGVGLRVHVILPMWAMAELVGGLSERNLGLVHAAAMTLAFVLVVLFRELGRIAAARALGADVADIELWPLGGLSVARPGGAVRRGLLSEAGGVLAGAAALPLLAAGVVLSGAGWDALVFNPLQPGVTAGALRTMWQVGTWWAYYAGATVLLANLVLPMAGFDLGRILERRFGAEVAGRVGVVVGLALFVTAAGAGVSRLVAAGMIGVVASWLQLQQGRHGLLLELGLGDPLRIDAEPDGRECASELNESWNEQPGGEDESDEEIALAIGRTLEPNLGPEGGQPPRGSGNSPGAIEPEPTLDEVLATISARGIEVLGATEWRVLQRETLLRRLADEVSPKDNDVVAAE